MTGNFIFRITRPDHGKVVSIRHVKGMVLPPKIEISPLFLLTAVSIEALVRFLKFLSFIEGKRSIQC